MINKDLIEKLVNEKLAETDSFLVNLSVSPDNKITVHIDNDAGLPISECVNLSRHIEAHLNRDEEDYELQVSSPGLDNPLRMFRQYRKNIGRPVEVLLADGKKIEGKLMAATEDAIEVLPRNSHPKRPAENIKINTQQIKQTKLVITFKK